MSYQNISRDFIGLERKIWDRRTTATHIEFYRKRQVLKTTKMYWSWIQNTSYENNNNEIYWSWAQDKSYADNNGKQFIDVEVQIQAMRTTARNNSMHLSSRESYQNNKIFIDLDRKMFASWAQDTSCENNSGQKHTDLEVKTHAMITATKTLLNLSWRCKVWGQQQHILFVNIQPMGTTVTKKVIDLGLKIQVVRTTAARRSLILRPRYKLWE